MGLLVCSEGRATPVGRRSDEATQHKLNAVADALADLMQSLARNHPAGTDPQRDLAELRDAVGLEARESA